MQSRQDPARHRVWVLVLPDAHDRPPSFDEKPVRVGITRRVGGELVLPPAGVVPGGGRVLGASVPVTTIDEDGQPSTGERDVDAAPRRTRHRVPDSISQPVRMEDATEGELGGGVSSTRLGQTSCSCWVGVPGWDASGDGTGPS